MSARPAADPKSKRAAKVADLIIEDVIALGWPVGQILGSETELLERYQVSRAVFREAVRIVEHQQVARTRRGPGGGLVITEPTVDAVIDAVVLYLYRVEARLDELFEARIVLEDIASELAPGRLDEQDLDRLRSFVDDAESQGRPDPRALHALVASISRNPAIELFVEVLNRVAMLYSSGWQNFGSTIHSETVHAHARIAEAVMSGDSGTARHRMRRHLEAEADYLRNRRSTRQLMPDSVVALGQPGNGKRAEAVARRITQSIVTDGLRPGQLVGTEPQLIEREGVSRAVLREAVRLLEHHQIARMRRGPGGGLFVFEPSAAAVTDVTAIYLARHGMRLADLAEVRTGVEVEIAGLAAARIDADGVARMTDALESEAKAPAEADCRARPACGRGRSRREPRPRADGAGLHPAQPALPDRAPGAQGAQGDQCRGAAHARGHRGGHRVGRPRAGQAPDAPAPRCPRLADALTGFSLATSRGRVA